ncbi:hypothetical protein RS030_162559 [Cryptosporidium xiaoi]|uniref:Uncharacterized protein n=1 Tax=Cryptosporidium xiaoi TaxID=659607 RepID=A0AAV9Y6S9_9CRYT
MWCLPKKIPDIHNNIGVERDFPATINKKALLVSGEIEDLKGCTNDIIEYAIILSKVYKYKEIRILQSEFSERLYGNFPSVTLNQLEGGTIIQIVKLTKKSLIEGFRWLIFSPLAVNEYINTDYYESYNNDFNMNDKIINSYYKGNELVFAYSGKSKLIELLNIDENELIYEPQFYISKEEQVSFSELEDIIALNKIRNSITNITCFMDCEYGHLFLLNYTREISLDLRNGINLENNVEIRHSRIKTLPNINSLHNTEKENKVYNKSEKNKTNDTNENLKVNTKTETRKKSDNLKPIILGVKKNIYCDPNISVIIFSSCLPNQTSQELSVCSNNGLSLSIIYRGLFSYSFHSFIKQNLMAYNSNNYNLGDYHIHKGVYNNSDVFNIKSENIFSFTLEYVLEELKNNMSYLINRNQLNEQFPLLTTSPNIIRGRSKLFQASFNAHIYNTSCYYNTKNNANNIYNYNLHNRNITYEYGSTQGFGDNSNIYNIKSFRGLGYVFPSVNSTQERKKETQLTFSPQFSMEINEQQRVKTENNNKLSQDTAKYKSRSGIFGGFLSSNKRIYVPNNLESSCNSSIKYDTFNQDGTQCEYSTQSSEFVLLSEISKLKNELDIIKKSFIKDQNTRSSFEEYNNDHYYNYNNKGNINHSYLQQLYNTNSVFKKSTRSSIGVSRINSNVSIGSSHFRTFTSK